MGALEARQCKLHSVVPDNETRDGAMQKRQNFACDEWLVDALVDSLIDSRVIVRYFLLAGRSSLADSGADREKRCENGILN